MDHAPAGTDAAVYASLFTGRVYTCPLLTSTSAVFVTEIMQSTNMYRQKCLR